MEPSEQSVAYDRSGLLVYFDRAVLALYRAQPNLYLLKEDAMGGRLEMADDEGDELPNSRWIDILFGFRQLKSGETCIAMVSDAFGEKLSTGDQGVWMGHVIERPEFAEDDTWFERWWQRYMLGSWEVEDGPKVQVARLVRLLRALTNQALQKPLLKFDEHELLNYPVAENTDAYAKAHLELYRLLCDGLNLECLKEIALKTGKALTQPTKSMNSLKELLPAELVPVVHTPLIKCAKERSKNHGVPSERASPLPAFTIFNDDLAEMEQGLRALLGWLEGVLGANAEQCLRREDIMSSGLFPKFSGPPSTASTLPDLQQAVGKTVSSVEFGTKEEHPWVHRSDAAILHFTDGSSLSLMVGSNALNIASDHEGLQPTDFCTDMLVFWAPAIDKRDTNALTVDTTNVCAPDDKY